MRLNWSARVTWSATAIGRLRSGCGWGGRRRRTGWGARATMREWRVRACAASRFKANPRGNPSPIPLEEWPRCGTRFEPDSFTLLPDDDYPRERLLPVQARVISRAGVEIGGLSYDSPVLDPYRQQRCPLSAFDGKWPIRADPREAHRVWFHDPADGQFHELRWRHTRLGRRGPLPPSPRPVHQRRVQAHVREAAQHGPVRRARRPRETDRQPPRSPRIDRLQAASLSVERASETPHSKLA